MYSSLFTSLRFSSFPQSEDPCFLILQNMFFFLSFTFFHYIEWLQATGSLRVRHGWATSLSLFTFMHWRRKWHPLQCSCLESPRDGAASWAAAYGVAQSRTRLKWLSSSSRIFYQKPNSILIHSFRSLKHSVIFFILCLCDKFCILLLNHNIYLFISYLFS